MRYGVLYPKDKTIDPRPAVASLDELLARTSDPVWFRNQELAAAWVRREHPEAIAIPLRIDCGSGVLWMMGVIGEPDRIHPENLTEDDSWPFVALVIVQAEDDFERRSLKKHGFQPTGDERILWACPVPVPPVSMTLVLQAKVALRVQGFPKSVPVRLGRDHQGNPTIYATPIDEEGISITFDKALVLELREWLAT